MKYLILLFLTIGISSPCLAKKKPSFSEWKKYFIKKYSKKGLPQKFLQKELKGIKFNPSIIKKDRNQISHDTTINYTTWIKHWLSDKPNRIKQGQKLLKKYSSALRKIERIYKVDKEIIISLWGVESKYGKYAGKYDVVASLATLAFDKRRRAFFEKELYSALKIIHQKHIPRTKMVGSWAGATGQCQFMPSNFLKFAQDYDNDGKKDIWNNPLDIMASIANYLKHSKWKKGKTVGQLAKHSRRLKINPERSRTPAQYNKLGIKSITGKRLKGKWRRKLALIPFKNSPLILRGSNYTPLMRWNKSSLFAALNILLIDAFKKNN